jgi:hypothetical protein
MEEIIVWVAGARAGLENKYEVRKEESVLTSRLALDN